MWRLLWYRNQYSSAPGSLMSGISPPTFFLQWLSGFHSLQSLNPQLISITIETPAGVICPDQLQTHLLCMLPAKLFSASATVTAGSGGTDGSCLNNALPLSNLPSFSQRNEPPCFLPFSSCTCLYAKFLSHRWKALQECGEISASI